MTTMGLFVTGVIICEICDICGWYPSVPGAVLDEAL
jgi:hypothetical protein